MTRPIDQISGGRFTSGSLPEDAPTTCPPSKGHLRPYYANPGQIRRHDRQGALRTECAIREDVHR
jgi:hypothetical protein